jgi:alkylhydroperoxidase family enzyme
MAHIRQIPPDEATGLLKRIYDEAIARAGKVFGILRIQSLNAGALEASMGMYKALMFGPSPLSRARREMLATVVSRANDCFY